MQEIARSVHPKRTHRVCRLQLSDEQCCIGQEGREDDGPLLSILKDHLS